jgi:hypothetical protein
VSKLRSYYGDIVVGEHPCICNRIPGLHRHQLLGRPSQWSEIALLSTIRLIAAVYQVDVQHENDSRTNPLKGWPDATLLGRNGVLYRELKDHYRVLTDDQHKIGAKLHDAGQNWAVWRPQHLLTAHIEQKIAGIA